LLLLNVFFSFLFYFFSFFSLFSFFLLRAVVSALTSLSCLQLSVTVVYQVVGYYVTIGSVQVVGFFDVAARLCAGDGPIAELVGTARSFLC